MESEIKVSVIIPVYNSEQYIRRCIETVLFQTLQEIEIICIDDGSSDDSLQILREFEVQDLRLQVISQENAGAAVARNRGMKLAKGKYLSILDADDFFEPDMLKKAYDNAEQHQCEITMFDCYRYDLETEQIWLYPGIKHDFPARGKGYFINDGSMDIFKVGTGAAWNKIFLRSFIVENQIEFQNNPPSDEIYFTHTAMMLAHRIGIVEDRLLYYQLQNDTSQMGRVHRKPESVHKALCAIKEKIEEIARVDADRGTAYRKYFKGYAFRKNMSNVQALRNYNLYEPQQMELYETAYQKTIGEYAKELGYDHLCRSDFDSDGAVEAYLKAMHTSPREKLYEIEEKRKTFVYRIPGYTFPYAIIPKASRIVLYGAGNVGMSYYNMILKTRYYEVVGWVDQAYLKWENSMLRITSPEKISDLVFDYVVIANNDENTAERIREFLKRQGVEDKKIIWKKPVYLV